MGLGWLIPHEHSQTFILKRTEVIKNIIRVKKICETTQACNLRIASSECNVLKTCHLCFQQTPFYQKEFLTIKERKDS